MLPRAGDWTAEVSGGGLGVFPVDDPLLQGSSGLDGGGGLAEVEKKTPGRGGDSGGVAAEPVEPEPEPVLEKL